MFRAHVLLTCALSLAFLGCTACQSSHETPAATSQASASSAPAVAQSGSGPKTDLAASITTACKSAPDGRFVGASLDDREGKGVYQIILIGKDMIHLVRVAADDGKLLESQDVAITEEMQGEIGGLLKLEPGVRIEQAITAALAEVPGSWARAAGTSDHENEPCYGVLVVQGTSMKSVLVSMKDAKVLLVSDAEEDDEAPEGLEGPEPKEGKEHQEATPAKPK